MKADGVYDLCRGVILPAAYFHSEEGDSTS